MTEAFREAVNALNQQWIKRLTQWHGTDVMFLSPPFEKGIQSFREFRDAGRLPRTFEDLFALMHIAYACEWMYHENDGPEFRRSLFLNVLQWHHAIATQEDKLLFVEFAFRLWCYPECSEPEVADYRPRWSLPEIHTEVGNTSSPSSCYFQQSAPQALSPSMASSLMSPIELGMLDLPRLRDKLGEGQVISLCTQFVHEFDNANINARKDVESTRLPWKLESPLESPIVMESSQSAISTDSPTRTSTSSTFLGSPGSSRNNSHIIPASNPILSNSPVEISSPTSDTSWCCDICNQSFHAVNDQDNRSNLKRHVITKHSPDQNPYRCPHPACEKSYLRRDNVGRHCRKDHGSGTGPYNGSLERRRTTDN